MCHFVKTDSGEPLPVVGVPSVRIFIGDTCYDVEFIISNAVDEILPSISFLAEIGAVWNFREGSLDNGGEHSSSAAVNQLMRLTHFLDQ
jgi:hypothetical protein